MRNCIYPDTHWRMRVDAPFSMAVEQDELFFLSAQADLQGRGEVQSGDLDTQTQAAIEHIRQLVAALGCTLSDLTKLVVYYVNRGDVDELSYLEWIAKTLEINELPVISLVPLEHIFYPGLRVAIDSYGVRETQPRTRVPTRHSPFPAALRQGKLIFCGAIRAQDAAGRPLYAHDVVKQSQATLEILDSRLASFGATRRDIVKVNNWYVGGASAKEWSRSAALRAQYYPEPGPVATGLPLERMFPEGVCIQTDAWIMREVTEGELAKQHSWPPGHWDWPLHLPFKHGLRCENLIFVGGQVALDSAARVLHAGDMLRQNQLSMQNIEKVLGEFGAGWADVVKLNAFYLGRDDPPALHAHLTQRLGYFSPPGPATTNVALRALAYPGMLTEFEAIAMVGEE